MHEQVHGHGAASRCCLSMPQAPSFTLPPSNTSWHLDRTIYWLSQHVEHFYESQQAISQRDRRPLMWKAVQIWGCLRWKFCSIWHAVTTRDMAYDSNNPVRKLVATSESLHKSFSQCETEFGTNTLLIKIPHFSTCKTLPRVLNTRSFKCM